jgi:hypothetical protein
VVIHWNDRTALFMSRWLKIMVMDNDDQTALYLNLRTYEHEINFGIISPAYSLRWNAISSYNNWDGKAPRSTTFMVYDKVHIVHTDPYNQFICDILNAQTYRPRLFVVNRNKTGKEQESFEDAVPVYSPAQCNKELDGMCSDDMFDFEHPYTTLVRILHKNEMIRYGLSSFLYLDMRICRFFTRKQKKLKGMRKGPLSGTV